MIETNLLQYPNLKLMNFIDECKKLGYKNNDSLHSMNFYWCLKNNGMWFETSVDKRIVGISGVHPFKDGYRALYRGCQLFSRSNGLTKNHLNCWMFYYHLPYVINASSDYNIYITTNTHNDVSGYMKKLNKVYFILEKNKIVSYVGCEMLNNTQQNIWLLNKDNYIIARGGI